jgi:hypothetical protein
VARGETRASAGRSVNVSLTGVLVAVPFECLPGEELVRIDSTDTPGAGEWRAGRRFRHISVESRCRLARFLMRRRAAVIEARARRNGVDLPERRAA